MARRDRSMYFFGRCLIAAMLILGVSACTGAERGEPDDDTAPADSVSDDPAAFEPSTAAELVAAPADPLDVTLELGAESVSQTIGPEGGVIEVETAAGLTHSLTIPEDALVVPTEIRVTPLTGVEGSGFEQGMAAGVQFEPHGLTLLRPAILRLEIPAATDREDLWGVSTLAGGEQIALHPILPGAEAALEMPIFGFSAYASFPGGRANAENLADRPVTSVGRRVMSELAQLIPQYLEEGAEAGLRGEHEDVLGELAGLILELKQAWLEEGILPLREAAMTDDIAFLRFEYEVAFLLMLEAWLQLLGVAAEGGLDEFVGLVREPMEAARDRALERCKSEHRLEELVYMLELEAQLQLLGAVVEGLDIFEAIASCARFRLVFESTITQEGSAQGVENRSTSFVTGEIDPLYPLEWTVVGLEPVSNGPLEYRVAEGTSVAEIGSGTCEATYVGGVGSEMMAVLLEVAWRPRRFGPWDVPEIYGKVDRPQDPPEPSEVRVALDPGDPIEMVTGSCPGFGDTTSESATWDVLFAIRHAMDLLSDEQWGVFGAATDPEAVIPEQTGFHFELHEFEGGRIYATGTWEGCQGQTATGGVFGETCERTFITLYHEPDL